MVVWAGCALCLAGAGCINNTAFWQKQINGKGGASLEVGGEFQRSGEKPPVVLGEHEITNAIVGVETNGMTRVSYGKDLRAHAVLVAGAVELAMQDAEAAFGMPLPLRPHIHLVRLPEEKRVIQWSMPGREEGTLPWLMAITNTIQSSEAVAAYEEREVWEELRDAPLQISVMVHEACETHLINPRELLVMPDFHAQYGFLGWHFKYRTRWFRDGLANYVGYKASEAFRRHLEEEGIKVEGMRFAQSSARPFTELARVRGRLFDWAQNSKEDYYAAATGLFFLLEHYKGAECIPAIVRKLPEVEFPDGEALQELVQAETGLDVRELVRRFEFPDLGMETVRLEKGGWEIRKVSAGGWAERAKLVEGDSLIEMNDEPLRESADLEIKILKAFERDEQVWFTYVRDGNQGRTEALALLCQ